MPQASAGDGSSTHLQRRWRNLLAWLEGHGFLAQNLPVDCRQTAFAGNGLFARSAYMPGSLLLVVPPKALLNKMTLKRFYPPDVQALTAVQLISIHLFIWRPKADEDSTDPSFGPYISILPRDFDSHPLTWLALSKLNKADDLQTSLLDRLPPSVLAALHHLHVHFWDDWCKVRTVLQEIPYVAHRARGPLRNAETSNTIMDFLWAWLNVNTRSIYYRLKHAKSDPENVTMCPIVDLANHTSGQACMIPAPTNSEIRNAAPISSVGDGLKFISPDNVKIQEEDEILLRYGSHSNKTLFVEYGFVNVSSENEPSPDGEVDVQDLVEKCVFKDVHLREDVKVALIAQGYWGGWTLHSALDSAQPSWRLVTALRLYHLVAATGCADEDAIRSWRDVVAGKRLLVSCENEQCWRKTIVLLCDMVIKRAEGSECVVIGARGQDKDSWARWMSDNVRALWREELSVAQRVKESVLRGDEF